jgi:prepilin-type N-terminal cleavage/methylation domain-containing protein
MKDQTGFTLVEMIIVIIIMGILAAVIIPQIGTTSADAKVSAVKQDLATMRNAVEVYYSQHNNAYPGAQKNDGSGAVGTAGEAATAFVDQLTKYSDIKGACQGTKDATHIYGPYLKGGKLPMNSFNDSNAVVCDIATNDITVRDWDTVGTAGWHFYIVTGVLVANDTSAHATGL